MTSGESKIIFRLLWRKKWIIIIGVIVVTFIAAVFSGPTFITPKYQSEIIIYPPNTNTNREFIKYEPKFGRNPDVDEHMQILKSNILRDSIIEKNNLIVHYKFKELSPKSRHRLNNRFRGNIIIDRTRHNAISITVLDEEPEMAARIANDIVSFGDKIKADILHHSMSTALKSMLNEFDGQSDLVDRLEDSLQNMLSGQEETDQFSLELEKIKSRYRSELYNMNLLKSKLAEIQSNLTQESPESYIISPAEVNYKKAWPSRKLVVMLATVGAFFLLSTLIVVLDRASEFLKNLQSE